MSKVKKGTAESLSNSEAVKDSEATGDFESSLTVLESLVERLEAEQLGLDESLQLYEKGMGLAKRCQSMLDDARQKVELIRGPGADPEAFEPGDNSV